MDGLINILSSSVLKTDKVKNTMKKFDRKLFIPNTSPHFTKCYNDAPATVFSTTISAPHMHAIFLENVIDIIKEGSKVLEIGYGTGYFCCCAANLAGKTGKIFVLKKI
jgi:protein-L-isoaspartate(D-aspartate) O-methyltransferase